MYQNILILIISYIYKAKQKAQIIEYFFVTGTNEITIDEEYYNEADNTRYELGNYFKTEEEAEKVKEELDKFWAKVREWEIGDD